MLLASFTFSLALCWGLEGPGVEGPGVEGPGVEGPGVEGPGLEGPGLEGRAAFTFFRERNLKQNSSC